MKTLKFMLAAATAIGLASAYADPEPGASTTFETLTQGTNVVNGLRDTVGATGSYFYYAGDPADNESTIVAAGDMTGITRPRGATGSQNNILQVSTGTNALFRSFQSFSSGEPLATTFTSDVYVDTLVQFTVTPYTDKVTPGDGDKLMIYLKESTNYVNEGGVDVLKYSTNLVVVGGYYDGNAYTKTEYEAQGLGVISPNTWHRLTVRAVANYGAMDGYSIPAFFVYFDGDKNPVQFDKCSVAEDQEGYVAPFNELEDQNALDNKQVVFSLLCDGETAATLQAVGFAGEGKVDDLMITLADPFVDPVQFTLSYGEGITAVEYTIGNSKYYTAVTDQDVYPGDTITIDSVTYANGYAAAANTATGLTGDGPYTVGDTACSLVLGATYATYTIAYELGGGIAGSGSAVAYTYSASSQTKTVAAPTCEGSNFVSWTISPNTVTISGTTLSIPGGQTGAITLTANWEAAQSGWADDPTVIPDNTPAATQYPALADTALATADAKKLTVWAKANNVDFSTVKDDASDYVEAFLLNCATGDVEDEKAEFVLSITFDSEGNPVVNLPDGKNYNGTLQMKGSANLTDWYDVSETSSTYKFYKYELSL